MSNAQIIILVTDAYLDIGDKIVQHVVAVAVRMAGVNS